MGLAKEKMFGKKQAVSKLEKLVERGVLLPIDVAYARQNIKGQAEEKGGTEGEIQTLAEAFAELRKGALTSLPKHAFLIKEIVRKVENLLGRDKKKVGWKAPKQLNSEQEKAFCHSFDYLFSLITGGPGTGKTFTACCIAHAYQKAHQGPHQAKILITAPTGKAAAYLSSQLDIPVKSGTLHSLLKISYHLDFFTRPIEPLKADLVIVDECSMIDPPLFWRLLSAIPSHTTLVLMGDMNQLPPVEGGRVFSDLVSSGVVPTTHLTHCMRSDRHEILNLAEQILSGNCSRLQTVDLGLDRGDVATFYQNLWEFSRDKDFEQFRILSTLRKGPFGVDALNQFLYEQFTPSSETFPIMVTRNDPATGLSNGEIGTLSEKGAYFSGGRFFEKARLPPFEYAYCISVHKSQGSEYDQVLLLIPKGSGRFGKEILYTAVTRAKSQIDIDASSEEMRDALQKGSQGSSLLCDALSELSHCKKDMFVQ